MATRRAKKRKWPEAELDAGVTPPASEKTEAGESPDQISNLHPDVLRRIVSLLPTKDGARTQSLSTRWRGHFRSAPLNLGVELRREDEPAPSSLVSRILADHQAPCRRLSLTWYGYKSEFVSTLLSRWLQSPALNGLSELDLWQKRKRRDEERRELPREEDPYALPLSVLRFSPTLRILSIKCTGCMIHFPSVGDLHLPILKQLTLKGVVVSEGVLHDVLAGCSVLESLVLSELDGVRAVRINSSTLRSLGVSSGWRDEPEEVLQQVIVEDAPLLEKLFLSGLDDHLSIHVLCAPKLDFLGSLPEGFSKAKLETTFVQRTVVASLMSVVPTVKVLVLRMSPPSVDDAIDFVKFFPCLEKLYVLLYRDRASKRARHHFPLGYIECLELHLKKVMLINYHGTPRDVDFARFFLLNAKVLEHMEFASRISGNRKKYISEWIAAQPRKLQLDNRASEGAQFNFIPDSDYCDGIHIGHIHDLTTSDPFDRSLCRCDSINFL
ncbi:putative F-box/FBD/LRR-repeat protein At1g78840 [Lolium perenne]|uniref:putative F-box/FBD/LRR-repeat protein At1g78840 n=1 Tax=Lolium perenne TaxID=4522 RepID=UPI0021F62DAE|nr:putative F-box/FBD/LRR-repeat protein At1g78760 [Lolium perenne]